MSPAKLPTPVQGAFSTDLFDCCAEPFGMSGCLYYAIFPRCAAGDMAVKMATGEVDRPKVRIPDCCICCGDKNADWTGYPWINLFTQCCGVYCGAAFAEQSIAQQGFTLAALRTVGYTYGLKYSRCNYCMVYCYCCCGELCIQLQIDRELIIRSRHRRPVATARAAGAVQLTKPRAQTMNRAASLPSISQAAKQQPAAARSVTHNPLAAPVHVEPPRKSMRLALPQPATAVPSAPTSTAAAVNRQPATSPPARISTSTRRQGRTRSNTARVSKPRAVEMQPSRRASREAMYSAPRSDAIRVHAASAAAFKAPFSVAPRENRVYSAWFQAAAVNSTSAGGQLAPQDAHYFIQLSRLPAPALSYVWTAVDARGGLNYQQFVMACRLITLVQNGSTRHMTREEVQAAMLNPLEGFPHMQGG